MADKKLQQLIINKGTEAKFNALPVKSDEQLYFITDSNTYVTTDQGMDNAGKILTVGADGKLFPEVKEWLPLSGGTITGDLTVRNASPSFTLAHSVYSAGATSSLGGTAIHPIWSFSFQGGGVNIDYAQDTKISFYPDGNNFINLGKPTNKWKAIYGGIINNGADIEVPTTGGTMVVATPPTTAGNYVLKATVAEDGTVTTQWVAEA